MLAKIMKVMLLLLMCSLTSCAKKHELHYASQDSSLSYVMERVVDKQTCLEDILDNNPREDMPIYVDHDIDLHR